MMKNVLSFSSDWFGIRIKNPDFFKKCEPSVLQLQFTSSTKYCRNHVFKLYAVLLNKQIHMSFQ